MKNVKELYDQQMLLWKHENEHYFGLTPRVDWSDLSAVEQHLKECADKFYNQGTCEFKKILEKGRCNNIDQLVKDSWEMIFDSRNGLICLYAKFYNEKEKAEDGTIPIKRAPIAYFPYPSDVGWYIGESEYILRITAKVNYGLISLAPDNSDLVKYAKMWTYNKKTGQIDITIDSEEEHFDPYDNLTRINQAFLKAINPDLNKENFYQTLNKVREIKGRSVLNFKFEYVSEVFSLITQSKRFANPLMKVSIPIDLTKMLTTKRINDDGQDNGNFTNLVLNNKNRLFALENARTVIFKSLYNNSFNFEDCKKFFDAFKTSTNKSAGRSRLLLDNAFIRDHMLWNIDSNGIERNMFELVLDENLQIQGENISIISAAPFSVNDAAKRIMMTAKLRTQALPTAGEIDPFTHDTPARIIFGDFEGFNNGDSIIISRSFARKLQSTIRKKLLLNNTTRPIAKKYSPGDEIPLVDFHKIAINNEENNYRHIILKVITDQSITIEATLPFSVGDKITNLHGSKGIVSLILEDEEMPYLENDLGCNMPKGYFDIIVSGISVYKRKSIGGIFEAWATASGVSDVSNIPDAVDKYYEQMREYEQNSVISWHGHKTTKPCGINTIWRLDHNAVSKQSHSGICTDFTKMLKCGEMELLNLAARGKDAILNELDIRSISKHHNAISQIKTLQETGYLNEEPANKLRFFFLLKAIGYDFNLRAADKYYGADHIFFTSTVSNDEIDLFDDCDDNAEEE